MNEELKQHYLSKVLGSQFFAKSSNNLALLRFLGESAIAGQHVKESIIGLALFGKAFDLDQNSARVRVNVYNLRQKLQKYYATEGQSDALVLSIPKGQYNLVFSAREKANKRKLAKGWTTNFAWGITVLLAIILLFQLVNKPSITRMPFWQDFFTNGKTTSVFVGDVFSFRGNTEFSSENVIRDFRFNNSQEFYDYLELHPEIKGQYKPNYFTYLTYMGPASVNRFSRMFASHGLDLEVSLSSNSDFQDIKTNNCIYVGPLTNKNRFVALFNYQSESIKIEDYHIVLYDSLHNEQGRFYGVGDDITTDYALITRIPGPENTEQFLFFASHDIGIVGVLDFFTNSDSLSSIRKKLPINSKYFSAIFKISGLERTSMKAELLYLRNIHGKYN